MCCFLNTLNRVSLTEWYTDMRRLTTGICSEKCVVGRFRRVKVIECTYVYTNLDSIAYYTLSLYIAYCS